MINTIVISILIIIIMMIISIINSKTISIIFLKKHPPKLIEQLFMLHF